MAVQSIPQSGTGVVRALTINLPREQVYTFWRNFENFPRFMRHLESVTVLDARRSHWVATAPAGTTVEWDAEITADEPGSLIAWHSIGDADIDNAGSVHFSDAPGDRGTELLVELTYEAPGGALGRGIAKLFGEEPKMQIREDMRRFKALIESGVIPTIIGQSTGEGRYKEDA
ncbi:MAG: SRPBCC family protein [Gemmatimonadaceae bacterium]|nr:SRPBCC family protein [Gemmatimonadaceae bacterium]